MDDVGVQFAFELFVRVELPASVELVLQVAEDLLGRRVVQAVALAAHGLADAEASELVTPDPEVPGSEMPDPGSSQPARDETPAARIIEVRSAHEGRFATVSVADRGAGIPDEIAARLFEPFFTTKSEGMGMGLNICRSIAELHHGRLGFEVRAGGGTIFTLSLPLDSPA